MATDAPIMLRAHISRAEWTALRQHALAVNMSTAQLVADALRAAYPLTPKADSE